MPEFRFSTKIRPRFFDLDVYRHVNNSVYATYCEEARVAYCRRLDIFQPGQGKVGFVVSKAAFEFLSPVTLGEELEIFIRAQDLGRARFDFAYLMVSLDRDKTVFKGLTTCVCWDLARQKPAPLAPRERGIITEFEEGGRG